MRALCTMSVPHIVRCFTKDDSSPITGWFGVTVNASDVQNGVINVGDTYTVATGTFSPTPPDPITITAVQIRKAFSRAGANFRTNFENLVANADQDTKDWWQHQTSFKSDDAEILQLAATLGYTAAQVYNVFDQARQL